jgi:hypothetical protein
MKNKELFDKTISILVRAYQGGTLKHSDTCGCAVGNLVANAMGYKITKSIEWMTVNKKYAWPRWSDVFCTTGTNQDLEKSEYYGDAKAEIDSTGYSLQNLAKIEFAFESIEDSMNDKDGYKGLMSVVDVLMKIHDANEVEVKQAKELFVLWPRV